MNPLDPPYESATVTPGAEQMEDFFRRILAAVAAGIARNWATYRTELTSATQDFLTESSADLSRWSGLLAAGAITPRDYQALVRARSALARMEAVSLAGLGRAEVSRFRALLVEAVLASALAVFLPGDAR